uniref:Uncharacterized protein n=1 Tax=Anguilla anguilla TaxID=7936 RepID=A0A0E9P9X0_ANGAN
MQTPDWLQEAWSCALMLRPLATPTAFKPIIKKMLS